MIVIDSSSLSFENVFDDRRKREVNFVKYKHEFVEKFSVILIVYVDTNSNLVPLFQFNNRITV